MNSKVVRLFAHMANGRSFGETIRDARLKRELSLRETARELGIAPSYLSDIENDRRIPSEEITRQLAQLLRLKFDDLMARAGRFGEEAERYLRKNPTAGVLFRKLTQGRYAEEELQRLLDEIEKLRRERK